VSASEQDISRGLWKRLRVGFNVTC